MTESFSGISVAVSMGFLATIFVVAYIRMLLKNAKNKAKLIEVSSRYEDLLKNIQGGVITCIFDKKTHSSKAVYISSGWTALTGYTLEDLKKECSGNPQALVYPEDRELANSAYMEQTAKGDTYKLQYRVVCKDGTVIWVIDRGVITTDANGAVYNQSIVTEVTEIKEKEEELLRMAQTDSLTGLYNKTTSAALAINTLEAQHDSLHALMILDIDNFKGINDSLGHIFGDTVLIEVSARLQQQMGPQDIIARIGGDEFMVLMTNINSCEEAEQKAEAICATFRNTYMGEHGSYKISCSMGIAFSTQGNGFKDLFEKADSTMYRAKTMGKDQYLVYNSAEDDGRFLGPGRMDIAPEKDSGGLEIKERFFELLYGSVDFAGSMNMALSLLGRIMDVGRVYVFENSHDNRLSSNTYEWCATGVASLQKKLQAVHLQDLDYLHLFDENGIFCCNDLSTLQSNSLAQWNDRQVRSLVQIAIKENGVACGIIGFDDYHRCQAPNKANLDLMVFAAKVIGVFILKKRAEEETALYNQNKMDALDCLPNSIYIIDETFHLHYMNNMTRILVPHAQLGDMCYQAFMKNNAPCQNCPAQHCTPGSASNEIYNAHLNLRFISNVSKIKWQGLDNMILVCCQDITHLTASMDN